MLTIWGRPNSSNVKKVLWCADELGLAYEHIPAGGAHGLVEDAAYRARNPNGLVPCIDDDGFILWESNAVVRYLAARYGEGSLWAADPAARARGDKWMDWATSAMAAPFRDVFWNLVRLPPEQRDASAVERGLKGCSRLLAIADAALGEAPFLSGETFGMGDIPLGCQAYAWFQMPIERPDLPNLAAWYERLTRRPAYAKRVMIGLS